MRKSILNQIIFIYAVISLFLILVIGTYTLRYFHQEQFRVMIDKTNLAWQILSNNIIGDIYTLNSVMLNKQVSVLSRYLKAQVFIYDARDRVIVRYVNGFLDDTEYEESEIEKQSRGQIRASVLSKTGKHFYVKEYFISSYPIFYTNELAGYFVIYQDRREILSAWNSFLSNLLLLIITIIIISLIVFIVFAYKLVSPINHLTSIASQINIKNMDLPLIHTEKNEIGELANQFRLMSANLKQSFDELHSQKDILWTIMNSINQALWIIDNNAHIKMANRHFGDLFFPSKLEGAGGGSDYYDEYLFDLTRNNDIIRLYHDILDEKTHLTREIEFNDKIYLCTVSYLQSNKNIIFTMLDISDIKSLEKMKKDLISNVSHELKTPLTAIKGFVETMMEDSTDEHRNYLEIIGRNTERLIAIVNDLLTLSKLEQTTKIIRQEIDIRAFFERVTSIVGNQSSVNITVDIADELKTFSADEFMMEQVFINLIDNAIKYGDKGTIKISAFKADYRLIFTVSDEGIGIPKHDLKRIFERFYVVDKSRSKRLGGTGLGLSIVKHIVHLHNGEISVESEEGKGSVFTIEMYL